MRIALIGDIGFFGKYSIENNSSVFDYFESVANYLNQFDYVVGNLELPFLQGGRAIGSKSAYLKSSPQNIELLKYLNINIVTLANNHIYDFGKQGLESTIKLLEEHKIQYFGVNNKDLILEDAKIAMHGYCCYSTNPYGLNHNVNPFNIPTVKSKLEHYHASGLLNLISVHAGIEHVNCPAYHDINIARSLTETCPYVYHGHHPHVLQGVERYDNSLLAYSLGNFCFDDVYTSKSDEPLVKQSDNNKSSAIVELEVEKGKLISHKTVGLYMGEKSLDIHQDKMNRQLAAYTQLLAKPEQEYTARRNRLLSAYVAKRKTMRNFNWYIKRLNFNSVVMILRAKFNLRQHKKNVLRYVNAINKP